MRNAVKILEELGQTTSLSQYNSLSEMLQNKNINEEKIKTIYNKNSNLICGFMPGDDKPDDKPDEKPDENTK